jgi:hypothetical protein
MSTEHPESEMKQVHAPIIVCAVAVRRRITLMLFDAPSSLRIRLHFRALIIIIVKSRTAVPMFSPHSVGGFVI